MIYLRQYLHDKFFETPRDLNLKHMAMNSSLVMPQVNTGSERNVFNIILMFIEPGQPAVMMFFFVFSQGRLRAGNISNIF